MWLIISNIINKNYYSKDLSRRLFINFKKLIFIYLDKIKNKKYTNLDKKTTPDLIDTICLS